MWAALLAGTSGVRPLSRFEVSDFKGAVSGEVQDFSPAAYLPAKILRVMDLSSQYACVAALEAVRDAGFDAEHDFGEETGVIFGSSFGGPMTLDAQSRIFAERGVRKVSPFTLANILSDSSSGYIAMLTGAMGPNMAALSASSSGATAIGHAGEIIRRGDAEVMIAGASEAPLTPFLFAGFRSMHAMAVAGENPGAACRPFDLHRNGFVVAEGSGAMVLESLEHAQARGAHIYAELAGYASTNDAFDMIAIEPSGQGSARAMAGALTKAALEPEAIGYINAHGTASRMNDQTESLAIKTAFGSHAYDLAVSSTKSMTGHLMGAAGALEAVISVLALRDQTLPPTINYEAPDPECDLDYVPNVSRQAPELSAVLSHSVGLGGHNASLIFRRL